MTDIDECAGGQKCDTNATLSSEAVENMSAIEYVSDDITHAYLKEPCSMKSEINDTGG